MARTTPELKVALAQMNPIVGDFAVNQEKIIRRIQEAESLGSDIVIFPELAVSGYRFGTWRTSLLLWTRV